MVRHMQESHLYHEHLYDSGVGVSFSYRVLRGLVGRSFNSPVMHRSRDWEEARAGIAQGYLAHLSSLLAPRHALCPSRRPLSRRTEWFTRHDLLLLLTSQVAHSQHIRRHSHYDLIFSFIRVPVTLLGQGEAVMLGIDV